MPRFVESSAALESAVHELLDPDHAIRRKDIQDVLSGWAGNVDYALNRLLGAGMAKRTKQGKYLKVGPASEWSFRNRVRRDVDAARLAPATSERTR